MRSLKKSRIWRISYAVCCLIYVVWVVQLSLNNFDMVHSDYRRNEKSLQPAQIKEIALQELVSQCRKELKRSGRHSSDGDKSSVATDDTCLSWPAAVLEQRQNAVERRLAEEQSRGIGKLVVFYVFFGIIFLILPPVLLYLLLSLFIWIFKTIKIAR